MLVLTRKEGEQIRIGEDVFVTVSDVCKRTGAVRIGIDAPNEIKILRTELIGRDEREGGGL